MFIVVQANDIVFTGTAWWRNQANSLKRNSTQMLLEICRVPVRRHVSEKAKFSGRGLQLTRGHF